MLVTIWSIVNDQMVNKGKSLTRWAREEAIREAAKAADHVVTCNPFSHAPRPMKTPPKAPHPRLKAVQVPPGISSKNILAPARPRISGAERERLILAEAVRFFSEYGFSGDTRELARRAHVTHPLLYKYFATKETLIERVYQVVYLGRWDAEWERLIADRSLPVRERMMKFYAAFSQVILDRDWVRLFMFFGLRGADINERWFSVMRDRLVLPFCSELRHELKLPSLDVVTPSLEEVELVQGISTRIFGFGIRQHIYGMPLPGDGHVDTLIQTEINVFFDGIGSTLRALLPAPKAPIAPRRARAPAAAAHVKRKAAR